MSANPRILPYARQTIEDFPCLADRHLIRGMQGLAAKQRLIPDMRRML